MVGFDTYHSQTLCKKPYTSTYSHSEIKSNASATTLPILNKGNFAKLPFPLPPYNEQQRIVNKIEELFTLLDNIQKSLEV